MPSWPHKLRAAKRSQMVIHISRACKMTWFLSGVGAFFFSAICQCQQVIYRSLVRHCVPHSRMSSALPRCQLGCLSGSPPWMPVPLHCSRSSRPLRVHVGTRAFLRESELFAVVSRDSQHMLSHPESGKSSTFSCLQFLPTHFMAGFRARGAKQWGMDGRCEGAERREMDLQCSGRVRRKGRRGGSQSRTEGECAGVYACERAEWCVLCFLDASVSVCTCVWCRGTREGELMLLSAQEAPWLVLTRIADHINATTHLSPPSPPSPRLPRFSLSLSLALSRSCHLHSPLFPARHHKPTAESWDTHQSSEGAGEGAATHSSPFDPAMTRLSNKHAAEHA